MSKLPKKSMNQWSSKDWTRVLGQMHHIQIPIYNLSFYLTTDPKLSAFISDAYDPHGRASGTFLEFGAPNGKPSAMLYGMSMGTAVIIHELIHLCMWVMRTIGSDPRDGNEEPMAYLMQYLYRELVIKKIIDAV